MGAMNCAAAGIGGQAMPPGLLNALIAVIPSLSVAASLGLYWKYRSQGRMRVLSILPLLVGGVLLYIVAARVEERLNPVVGGPLGKVSEEALALHRDSDIVDLHADSLLFGRDLLERSSVGHVDVPRLLEGGVTLQVFSVVTRQPWGYNEESTDPDRPDLVTLLALFHLWPPSTYFSLHERVLYHARRLEDVAARSDGRLRLVRDREDLEGLLHARRAGEAVVGGLLAIEGSHVLGSDFRAELDTLFEHGLRMASFTHFFDNEYGGSVQGLEKGGLTPSGRELVAEFERRGIAIDLSHGSRATIEDVLAIARKPVVFSHTGVEGTCDQYHNLGDDLIRAIATNGGVIGVGFWDTAVCGTTAADTVRAMRHAIDLVGDSHVGLGSDFDGYVLTHFDASGLPVLTQAMLDAGLQPDTIRRILGGNVVRVLRSTLP
jgi:microsomal dipeptidase-like Zn-dependent dipeptidase